MRNNYNTELNRNHSFGKLRRKVKKETKKVDINPDFEKNNNYNNNYRTIENTNPLHSKYNNIYSLYNIHQKDILHISNNILKESMLLIISRK